jgi:hypothetical protein
METNSTKKLVAGAALALVTLVSSAQAADATRHPAHWTGWRPVDEHLAGALAEGDKPDATTYPWERCKALYLFGQPRLIRCPDGYRERL